MVQTSNHETTVCIYSQHKHVMNVVPLCLHDQHLPMGGAQADVFRMLAPLHLGNLYYDFAGGWSSQQYSGMSRDL